MDREYVNRDANKTFNYKERVYEELARDISKLDTVLRVVSFGILVFKVPNSHIIQYRINLEILFCIIR